MEVVDQIDGLLRVLWVAALDLLGERLLFVLVVGLSSLLFLPAAWLLAYVDRHPGNFLHRYKIGKVLGDHEEQEKLLRQAMVNVPLQFSVLYFVLYPIEKVLLGSASPMLAALNNRSSTTNLTGLGLSPLSSEFTLLEAPTLCGIVFETALQFCLLDTFVYFSHRWMHSNLRLWRYHKHHHRWKTPLVMSAVDVNLVEAMIVLFGFVGIRVLMQLFFSVHWVSQGLFLTIHTFFSIYAHSGYEFPWLVTTSSSRHFYHHWRNNGCFGSYTAFWDSVCGTDREYRRWRGQYDIFQGDFGQTPQDARLATSQQ